MTGLLWTPEEGEQHIAAVREWAAARELVFEGSCEAWAVFSPDRVYRYLLGRTWSLEGPTAHVTMLNPSKAGVENDPTVTRVVGLTRRKFGGALVSNRFAFIATDPKGLLTAEDPRGPHNDAALMVRSVFGARIVAWGVIPRKVERRATPVSASSAWCWGKTKDGHPRHPLYLRGDTPLVSMADGRAFP